MSSSTESVPQTFTRSDLKSLKQSLQKFHESRKASEVAKTTQESGWVSSIFSSVGSWISWKSSEEPLKEVVGALLSRGMETYRKGLCYSSTIEELLGGFTENKTLEDILIILEKRNPSPNADHNDEEQRKILLFAVKQNLSLEHLNGYLEALEQLRNLNNEEEKEPYKQIVDCMQRQVDSYWNKQRQSSSGKPVEAVMVADDMPSRYYPICPVIGGPEEAGIRSPEEAGNKGSEDSEDSEPDQGYTLVDFDPLNNIDVNTHSKGAVESVDPVGK